MGRQSRVSGSGMDIPETERRLRKRNKKMERQKVADIVDGAHIAPGWWSYERICENEFFTTLPVAPDLSTECPCVGDPKCADKACPNRQIDVECPADCKPYCWNQRIRNRCDMRHSLHRFYAGARGAGLMTSKAIRPGELVIEYVGEVIREEEYQRRLVSEYKHIDAYYALELQKGILIDSTVKGNDSRFINHSCDPNCKTEKWEVDGQIRVGIFSIKDIAAGDELTYSYNFQYYNNSMKDICMCGASNCKGSLRGTVNSLGNGKKEYKCVQCPKSFTNSSSLRSHRKKHEGKEYKCTTKGCGKVFPQKSTLTRHVNTIHSGEKVCHVCDKWLANQRQLQHHLLKHVI